LKILEHNSKTAEHGSYFEVGNIYWKEGKDIEERTYLSILAFDRRRIPSEVIVGGLKEFFRRLNVDAEIIQESEQMAQVKTSGKIIGRIASLPVSDLPWLGVHLELDPIQKLMKEPKFEQFTKYPSVSLDVAVLVRKDLPWQQLENLVRKQSKLIVSTELLDIYEGKNISPNRKSLAFRVVYQAPDRTLTDKEVEKVHAKLLEELKNKFSAQIRD